MSEVLDDLGDPASLLLAREVRLTRKPPAVVPPAVCARGHALVWLLGPAQPFSEGEGLAACDCSLRGVEGRLKNGSQPTLWRWVPARPRALSPIFPSQNRLAFALALRLRATIMGTAEPLHPGLGDTAHQRAYVKLLSAQAAPLVEAMKRALNPNNGRTAGKQRKVPKGATEMAE